MQYFFNSYCISKLISYICKRQQMPSVCMRSHFYKKGRLRTLSSDVESRKFKPRRERNGASTLGVLQFIGKYLL